MEQDLFTATVIFEALERILEASYKLYEHSFYFYLVLIGNAKDSTLE